MQVTIHLGEFLSFEQEMLLYISCLPVDYRIEDENDDERSDDVQENIGPKTINIDIPEVHSITG